jgi:hypothetical protein
LRWICPVEFKFLQPTGAGPIYWLVAKSTPPNRKKNLEKLKICSEILKWFKK